MMKQKKKFLPYLFLLCMIMAQFCVLVVYCADNVDAEKPLHRFSLPPKSKFVAVSAKITENFLYIRFHKKTAPWGIRYPPEQFFLQGELLHFESFALCLCLAGSITAATDFDVFGVAVAAFIVSAVVCLAVNLQILIRCGAAAAVFRTAGTALLKIRAASLVTVAGSFAVDINVRTAAAAFAVIDTVTDRASQFCHLIIHLFQFFCTTSRMHGNHEIMCGSFSALQTRFCLHHHICSSVAVPPHRFA